MEFRFAEIVVDTERYEVRRAGEPVAVEPQVFDLLVYLIRHRQRVVTKAELLDNLWGDRFVSESALTSRIRALRRAVGDDGRSQHVVRTVHGRGYRFVAEPTGTHAAPDDAAPTSATTQQISFCRAHDGVRLAYAVTGDGPPLVKAANWLSHLEYDWENPTWRHWWIALSRSHRLIRYDARGCGLSDWNVDPGTYALDTWVDDLATVVDSAGVDRFDLLGISQGGAVALAYAAAHPERVRHLVLYGTYLARASHAPAPTTRSSRRSCKPSWRVSAGVATTRRSDASSPCSSCPMGHSSSGRSSRSCSGGRRHRRTRRVCSRATRRSTSPRSRPASPFPRSYSMPRGDRRVPVEQGRLLAAAIPGARFVTLDSQNHILLADEPAWTRFLAEVESFLE